MKGEPNPLFFPLDFDEQKQEVTLLPYHASLFSRLLCVLLMQNMERNVMSYQQKDSRPSKARIKSPPLSGGEVARKTEEKGRGLSERSEFRRPRRRLRRQTQKPDNRGGASWFVLLAAEKNEQTKCISCIRDYLWRGKKIISIQPSPPAVPRSIAGCGARKYRGELRSVATRRGVKNTRSESNRGKPPLPLCRATI